MNISQLIYDQVKMKDVLEKYHSGGKRGRAPCPFHNGKDNNLSYTDEVYHCWVCGAKGNVIGFVMDLFHLDFSGAVQKINYDFGLNLPTSNKMTVAQHKQLAAAEKRRKEELQAKRAAEKRIESLWNEFYKLDVIINRYRPKSPEEPLKQKYVDALKQIETVKFRIDTFEWEEVKI